MRSIAFHAKARETIREFPRAIRDRLGKALYLLQVGERPGMPLSRPMPTVGAGVAELRLRREDGQFRTFYLMPGEREVLVFHAFVKKTQKTPVSEIELGRKRLKEMRSE